jgi:8-amino-7-oxononanoate synthase
MLGKRLEEELNKRKTNHALRTLGSIHPQLTDFSSNDYLGLSKSIELKNRIEAQLQQLQTGNINGASGSRLLTGNYTLLEESENFLAQHFNSESGLIFQSGYMANLAVLSALPVRGDTVLYDEQAHACMKDGIRLSTANRFPFLHNDLHDLEKKLKKATGNIFVAVESVYSMDGDVCPLKELVTLCEQYHACIILDEAHSTGLFGDGGKGLAYHLNVHDKIGIRVYTFGKAMGVHGAFVASDTLVKDYIINFARPFIYTTAPDVHTPIAMVESVKLVQQNPQWEENLNNNIQHYRKKLNINDASTTRSAIQSFLTPGNKVARQAAQTLNEAGFDIRPILAPTVKEGTERLRIILHRYNSSEEINKLTELLLTLKSTSTGASL